MSYDPRRGGRPQGPNDAGQGQTRAARGRNPIAPIQTRVPDTSRMTGLPHRPNQPPPLYSSRRANDMPLRPVPWSESPATGRESPELQWPLPNNMADVPYSSPVLPPRSPKRLQPPQEFTRSFSDDYPVQQLSAAVVQQPTNHLQPSHLHGVSHTNDSLLSPDSYSKSRPFTTSSAVSEASSLGDIPDFPVADRPYSQQARRVPELGPPPSARKGPPSYYTQMPYVSPIVEESDARSVTPRTRHGSFASSNVIPVNSDDYYLDDDPLTDDETITSNRGTITPEHDDRSGLVAQPPALVRQASLGRRTKPSLMTIKSMDSLGSGVKSKAAGMGAGTGTVGVGGEMPAARDSSPLGMGRSLLGNRRGLTPTPSSDRLHMARTSESKSSFLAGSTSSPHPLSQDIRPVGLAERTGTRRPLMLDMDAVRDAEARGSLTSLPDLIRRATKLAANLDRGRTASRLGLDFWETGVAEKRDRRQSGLSDMLAAFPSPGQDTPLREATPNAGKWPFAGESRTDRSNSGLSHEKSKKPRRCCGMPMWVFILLLIVLLLAIAAAVTIPIFLVVLPNQNKSNSSAAQDNNNPTDNGNGMSTASMVLPGPTSRPSSAQCDGVITCQNGGIAIPNANRSCNCICINGFTGRTCTDNDKKACTAISIANTADNATVGTGIPRLVDTAHKNFNVPLDATRILSLFSNLALSCAAENALITFNGLASRSISPRLRFVNSKSLYPTRSFSVLHHPHPPRALDHPTKRQNVGQSTGGQDSNEKKETESNKLQTQPVSSNVMALDFARVGVLLALQESGDLDTAASAQETLQKFLTSNRNDGTMGTRVELGTFDMDLVDLTIRFRNGTTIRASPSGAPADS